jgi:hypothetical protein
VESNAVLAVENLVRESLKSMSAALKECHAGLRAAVSESDHTSMQALSIACAAMSVVSAALSECLLTVQLIQLDKEVDNERDTRQGN